jgi:prophage antirepressor-like protein
MTSFLFKHSSLSFELINYGTTKDIYFKAKDVATFLGYKKPKKAIKDHVWEIEKIRGPILGTHHPDTIFITECGLYQLIFNSKMDIAQKFQQWVFKSVLPKIRQTGQFSFNNITIKPNLTFNIETEFDIHKQVVNFLKVKYPYILLSIQNGELQNDTYSKRIKSYETGYEAGSFDIIINNLNKNYNGFAIEIKSPNGKGVISDKQLIMQKKYEMNNFKTLISNNYNEILFQIIEYMNNTRIKCLHCKRKFKNENTLNNHYKYFHKINI